MNPFEALAERQLSAPVKAKHRAAEKRAAKRQILSDADAPMAPTQAEKDQQENTQLLRQWRRWHREQSDELLESGHGKDYRGLLLILRTLEPSSGPALLQWLEQAAWVQQLDRNQRLTLLHEIGNAIATMRRKIGLEKSDIDFVVSGSSDYLAGMPFSFVGGLDGYGAWPPISATRRRISSNGTSRPSRVMR